MTVQNIGSESWCRKAYLNYHCYNNTMGLSPEDMGEIAYTWGHKISSWQVSVSSDETEYDFDDSEYDDYINQGKAAGEEATGYEKNQGDDIAAATGHALGGATSAVFGTAAAAGVGSSLMGNIGGKAIGKVSEEAAKVAFEETSKSVTETMLNGFISEGSKEAFRPVAEKAGQKAGEVAAEKAAAETTKEATKQLGDAVGFIISTTMGAATAAAYLGKNPNKEEKEACDVLQTEMAGAQGELMDKQSKMESIRSEVETLSDEANEYNEEANATIADQKSEYDFLMQTYTALKAKIDAGQPLEKSEQSLYRDCVKYMQEASTGVEETADTATEEVSTLYDEIGGYQEDYDGVAQSMGEVQGLTDYAGSFDNSAKILCLVEGAAQTLNAAGSAVGAGKAAAFAASGSWAFGATAWAWAFVVLGAFGAATSGVGAAQQFKWASEINKEIDARGVTEELNTTTMTTYEEEIDGFDATMQGVEDLELIMPDDIEAPEAADIPTSNNEPQNNNPFLLNKKE